MSNERILFNLAKGYAEIKQANSVAVHALEKIDGYPIQSVAPSEILGAIRSVQIAREALKQAGRDWRSAIEFNIYFHRIPLDSEQCPEPRGR